MFNYLLYKGYLSKNNEFQFSDKQARDIDGLLGTNVIAGTGVCRHISAMLTDILCYFGIESYQLGVYSKDYTIKINILSEPKYTKEQLIDWVRTHITDVVTYDSIMKLIEKLYECNQNIEISSKEVDSKKLSEKIIGNHAISYALKDEKSYFLDPTQTRIYRMSETDNNLLYDGERELSIKPICTVTLNDRKDYFKLQEHLKIHNKSILKEEEKLIAEKTITLCNENNDLFEKFYAENKELYDDISSKLLKIKKRKYTLR